jgi:hypothetical protein
MALYIKKYAWHIALYADGHDKAVSGYGFL